MARLILEVSGGARPSTVTAAALNAADVTDAVEANQAGAVIVTVDQVSPDVRQRLADLPGVVAVHDDLQGLPQVADEQEVEDFLNRVRDLRDEDDVPALIEARPVRTDGGAQPAPAPGSEFGLTAMAQGEIDSIDASVTSLGAKALHGDGVTGESIIAVVVDTGLCPEAFEEERRLGGLDLSPTDDPWDPISGHGGMTGGILAGSEQTTGIDVGFLPDADVYPIKTTFAASELLLAQDTIVELAEENPQKTILVNNSWGFIECGGVCGHPITNAVDRAARRRDVIQVFAAGNQAEQCGTACDGSTPGINGPNSLRSVVTVGATGANGQAEVLHDYSARGAEGEFNCGRRKPDLTAPTFGLVPWGCGERAMGNGGGTSAACPMVAGAMGLLAETVDDPGTNRLRAALQDTATSIANGFDACTGDGNARVDAAAGNVPPPMEPVTEAGFGSHRVLAVGLAAGLAGAMLRRRVQN